MFVDEGMFALVGTVEFNSLTRGNSFPLSPLNDARCQRSRGSALFNETQVLVVTQPWIFPPSGDFKRTVHVTRGVYVARSHVRVCGRPRGAGFIVGGGLGPLPDTFRLTPDTTPCHVASRAMLHRAQSVRARRSQHKGGERVQISQPPPRHGWRRFV